MRRTGLGAGSAAHVSGAPADPRLLQTVFGVVLKGHSSIGSLGPLAQPQTRHSTVDGQQSDPWPCLTVAAPGYHLHGWEQCEGGVSGRPVHTHSTPFWTVPGAISCDRALIYSNPTSAMSSLYPAVNFIFCFSLQSSLCFHIFNIYGMLVMGESRSGAKLE